MDSKKLKDIISNKSDGDSNLSMQLYQMFFFEHILERISKSEYKYNIILKGGLLLSSIIGDDIRTTRDMDATLKSLPLEKDYITKVIQEILDIDIEDNISFEIVDIKDIREEDEYGGFKINILAKMDKLRVYLAIELTTGDKITPKETKYQYQCIFEDKKIPILAYTIETVIAEKYHSIVTRGTLNTRMKDFYDIYVLLKENRNKIDFNNLTLAIKNTFKKRETELDIVEIKSLLNKLEKADDFKRLWINYQTTSPYAKRVNYNDLFEPLNYITSILEIEIVPI